MSTLFFEGFNLLNTDNTIYLDPNYWSKPYNPLYPPTSQQDRGLDGTPNRGTHRHILLEPYRTDTSPQQFATPLQLSGISGLNSDQLYISLRAGSFTYNDPINTTFPHTVKFLTLCDGDNESLTFDIVQTSGVSIQGGTWSSPNYGIGISVKQSGTEIGLYDLRVGGINEYDINNPVGGNVDSANIPLSVSMVNSNIAEGTRFMHLEFLIDRINKNINFRLEGFDVLNRLSSFPYNYASSGDTFGSINNLKFYNRGANNTMANGGFYALYYGRDGGRIRLDDIVIVNNSGDNPKMWIGPNARIFHFKNQFGSFPKSEWSVAGNGADYSSSLNTRNGDVNYLFSETSGQIASFNPYNDFLQHSNGYFSTYIKNGIGGVKIFNDVRKTYLDSDYINVYGTGNTALSQNYIEIGNKKTVTETNYKLQNIFLFNDPITLSPWTSGTFFSQRDENYMQVSGAFGIKKL